MEMLVKEGSLWKTIDNKRFRVISVVETDGHTWVHYREENNKGIFTPECREYSCYQESFVSRFSESPE